MNNLPRAIGILGGTFDPIHLGHLRFAEEIALEYPLSEIRFMPAWQTVHRTQPLANFEQRVAMLRLAIAHYEHFVVDLREGDRKGPSYTLLSLQSLRAEFPNISLCLLLAADSFNDLETWPDWQRLFDYAHLIIASRPGYVWHKNAIWEYLQPLVQSDPNKLLEKKSGAIFFSEINGLDISATTIRKYIQLRQFSKAQPLLPNDVWAYIQSEQLYL